MQSNLRGQRHFLGIAAFSRDYVRMPATGGHSSSEFRTQSSLSPTRSWFSRISGIFDSSPARMPRHRRAFEFGIQSSELRARPTIVSLLTRFNGFWYVLHGADGPSTSSPSVKACRNLRLPSHPGFGQMVKILQLSGPNPPRRKKTLAESSILMLSAA
jgi:hypothetical protein